MERFDFEKFDRDIDIVLLAQEQLRETLLQAVKFNALPEIEAEEVYYNFMRTHGLVDIPKLPDGSLPATNLVESHVVHLGDGNG